MVIARYPNVKATCTGITCRGPEVITVHPRGGLNCRDIDFADNSIMMLEADVRTNTDGIAVMAHTTADIPFSNQTLQQWLQEVMLLNHQSGV